MRVSILLLALALYQQSVQQHIQNDASSLQSLGALSLGNPERRLGQTAIYQRCQRLGIRFSNNALLNQIFDQALHGLDAMPLRLGRSPAKDRPGILQNQTLDFWGVTEEDRKALLAHKNGGITSHYSAAELGKLIDEANRISATDTRGPALTILRRMAG